MTFFSNIIMFHHFAGSLLLFSTLSLSSLQATVSNLRVSTIAGGLYIDEVKDGFGTNAVFHAPMGIDIDKQRNVYIADNSFLRKITLIQTSERYDWQVSTMYRFKNGSHFFTDNPPFDATPVDFGNPQDVAVDKFGKIYVTSPAHKCVYRVIPGAGLSKIGSGIVGLLDGPMASARFTFPNGIASDSNGTIYVADTDNNAIRQINSDLSVKTILTSVARPIDVAVDINEKLLITREGSSTICKLSLLGPKLAAPNCMQLPVYIQTSVGIAVDLNGDVFLADTNKHRIIKLNSNLVVEWIAGNEKQGYVDGPIVNASFAYPPRVAVDDSGSLFIVDNNFNVIRTIPNPDGEVKVSTILGGPYKIGFQLDFPIGIDINEEDDLYVSDTRVDGFFRISSNSKSQFITNGISPILRESNGEIDFGGNNIVSNVYGSLYVIFTNSCIKKYTDGTICARDSCRMKSDAFFVCNNGLLQESETSNADFSNPKGAVGDSYGNLYVADTENDAIRVIRGSDNYVSTFITITKPLEITIDNRDNLYIIDMSGHVFKVLIASALIIPLSPKVSLTKPRGIAVDSMGNIYISDTNNHRIFKFDSNFEVVWQTGMEGSSGHLNGRSDFARFSYPTRLAVDKSDNVYVADTGNHAIRKIEFSGKKARCNRLSRRLFRSDGVCKTCPVGQESAFDESRCIDCPINTFRSSLNFPRCIPCPSGRTCSPDSILDCPNSQLFDPATGCKSCPIGTQKGSDQNCIACPQGTYRFSLEQPSCLVCPENFDCSSEIFVCKAGYEPKSSLSTCQKCSAGTYKNRKGNFSCSECPVGSEISSDGIQCAKCQVGYQRINFGVLTCSLCPQNSICNNGFGEFWCNSGFKYDEKSNECIPGNSVEHISQKVVTIPTEFPYLYVDIDDNDNIFLSDYENIVRIERPVSDDISNEIWTVSKVGSNEGNICDLAVDNIGNLYQSNIQNNCVYKLTPYGTKQLIGGCDSTEAGKTDGRGTTARFTSPCGLTRDSNGNIYVADTGNNAIRIIKGAENDVSTLIEEVIQPTKLTVDSHNNLYVLNRRGEVFRFDLGQSSSSLTRLSLTYALDKPSGIAVDSLGNIYISDTENHRIIKINSDLQHVWIAGKTAGLSGDTTDNSLFHYPTKIAIDKSDNLVIADYWNFAIRMILALPKSQPSEYQQIYIASVGNCPHGEYNWPYNTTVCLPCPINAEGCFEDMVTCKPGFLINQMMTDCVPIECDNGFFLTNGECKECPIGQQIFDGQTECVTCPDGTYRSPALKKCYPCPLHSTCSGSTFECNSGYHLSEHEDECAADASIMISDTPDDQDPASITDTDVSPERTDSTLKQDTNSNPDGKTDDINEIETSSQAKGPDTEMKKTPDGWLIALYIVLGVTVLALGIFIGIKYRSHSRAEYDTLRGGRVLPSESAVSLVETDWTHNKNA